MLPKAITWRATMLTILLLTACSPKTSSTGAVEMDPASAAAKLADLEAGKYGPLDQLGNTGLTFQLRPEKSGRDGLFTLEITNAGTAAAVVEKVGLVQVGLNSTGATTAAEASKDARVLNWQLAPGDRRQLPVDLNELMFDGMTTADGRRPAMEFVRRLPESDRRITVVVWHRLAYGGFTVEEPVRSPE